MASELTIRILRQIRTEIRGTNARLDQTNARLDTVQALAERIPAIETVVERISQEQLFLSRWVKMLTGRERRLASEMEDVHGRVATLERRSGGEDS